jgi:hypothetical protein
MDSGVLVDWIGSLTALFVLTVIWFFHFRSPPAKRIWNCVRYYGGGSLTSPKPMTLEEVTQWLANDMHVEIAYIDHEHGFIFYRPK